MVLIALLVWLQHLYFTEEHQLPLLADYIICTQLGPSQMLGRICNLNMRETP